MRYRTIITAVVVASWHLAGCASTPQRPVGDEAREQIATDAVNLTLSIWHEAASRGLFDMYFEQMTDDSIFLGTDSTEIWNKEQFMDYAREPFADGHGWTYTPSQRHIRFNYNYTIAWLDETLTHEKYGTLRGTAVLSSRFAGFLIEQYSLTFLVPNEIAGEVVETIKQHKSGPDEI